MENTFRSKDNIKQW